MCNNLKDTVIVKCYYVRFKTVQELWLYHSIQEIEPFIIIRLLASCGWPPSVDRRTGRQGSKKWPHQSRDLNPCDLFFVGLAQKGSLRIKIKKR